MLAFALTLGQKGDAPQARDLLATLPAPALCLADAAYDSDRLRAFMVARGTEPVIPNNPTRRRHDSFDRPAYKGHNVVEGAIGRLKDWRCIHTRYDKLAANFASASAIAAILQGWC